MAKLMTFNEETRRKWRAFRRRPRAFYSLLILLVMAFGASLADIYANSKPVVASYNGELYFPAFKAYSEKTFGGMFDAEADYTDPFVKEQLSTNGNWAWYPPIPWRYDSINRDPNLQHPSPPSSLNWLGTDDRGRDVLTRLIYGFRISLIFGLVLVAVEAFFGAAIGAIEGFFGGWTDLIIQRLIEIWAAVPSLYLLIIMASIFEPSLPLLIALLSLFGWIGIQYLVRAEFLRARQREYVKAARALGVNNFEIMLRHILPNALTLVITNLPFSIAGAMTALVSLDYLGFGVPPPTPSLGELMRQAQANLNAWWIGVPTIGLIISMLVLVTFVGEAILDVFDPKRR